MNIVIYSDKKVKRYFDANMDLKSHNVTVLGYETEIRSNFVKRITEYYNPHILVLFDGVKQYKDFNLENALKELRAKKPNLRIIYLYGNIDNEADFLQIAEKLLPYEIYDIVTFSLYSQGFKKQFVDLLENPMTKDDFQLSIEKSEQEKAVVSETLKNEIQKIIDNTPVLFSKEDSDNEFDVDTTENIDEIQEHIDDTEHISIGVSCVTYNSGVAQTAFEIATMLSQAKNKTALFLTNELYARYLEFHGIEKADNGFTANGLPIFPMSEAEQAVNYKFTVYELTDTKCPEQLEFFENADIKISLCTGTEWDISYLQEYLNSPLRYLKEINYCFYPISQPDFMKYNKQMIKGHCKAYRLRTSPNYTNPCQWNRDVYTDILNRYLNVNTNKKFGLFRLR